VKNSSCVQPPLKRIGRIRVAPGFSVGGVPGSPLLPPLHRDEGFLDERYRTGLEASDAIPPQNNLAYTASAWRFERPLGYLSSNGNYWGTRVMSLPAQAWAWKQKIPLVRKFVLIALADRHNGENNQLNPSIARLAEDCQCSRTCIKDSLKQLEIEGFIKSRKRYGKRGRLTNQYALNMAGFPEEEVEELFDDEDEDEEEATDPPSNTKPSSPPSKSAPPAPTPVESTSQPTPRPVREAVERVFTFYCATFERSERDYTLTPARRSMAEDRLRERLRRHLGDVTKAETDLAKAIKNVAASDYHREHGFVDWGDQIFRSREQFEKQFNLRVSANAKNQGNGGGGKPSPAAQRRESSREAIRAVASRRYGIGVFGINGSASGTISESGTRPGYGGDVPGGMGADRTPIRPGDAPPRVIEAQR